MRWVVCVFTLYILYTSIYIVQCPSISLCVFACLFQCRIRVMKHVCQRVSTPRVWADCVSRHHPNLMVPGMFNDGWLSRTSHLKISKAQLLVGKAWWRWNSNGFCNGVSICNSETTTLFNFRSCPLNGLSFWYLTILLSVKQLCSRPWRAPVLVFAPLGKPLILAVSGCDGQHPACFMHNHPQKYRIWN